MGKVTLGDPSEESAMVSRREKITELRKELQKAEPAAAIEEASGVLSVVEPMTAKPKTKLGPTLFASVAVNGVPTDALVDTGSPAPIISLEFVLKVLANEWTLNQTVQGWKEPTHKKLVSPKVSMQNYGGHRVDIMAQIEVSLSQGERQVDVVVFFQKGDPDNLFLGTDVQPYLGFSLIVK